MVQQLRTFTVFPGDLKFGFLKLAYEGSPMPLHIHTNKKSEIMTQSQ